MRYAGKCVVVTGAGSGIGAAIAKRLATEGANVLAVDRNGDGLSGWPGRKLVVDLTDDDAPRRIVEAAAVDGHIDVLVNNAGVGGSRGLLDSDDAEIARILGTNLIAVMRLTREAVPRMTRPGANILNISSNLAHFGYPGVSVYAAAKGGVSQLTQQLTAELAGRIRVNAISPGVTETPLLKKRWDGDAKYKAAIVESIPVGRSGQPEDIAAAAAFLCSDEAGFVAGVDLIVDGGQTFCRISA